MFTEEDLKRLREERDKTAAAVEKLTEDRKTHVTRLESIVETAAKESRDFSIAEAEERGRLNALVEGIDAQLTAAEDQARAAKKAHRNAKKEVAAAQGRVGFGYTAAGVNAVGGNITVNLEHRTYEKGNGLSYLQDICAVGFGPGIGSRYFSAIERIQRHAQENHVVALEAEAKGSIRSKEEEYFLRQMVEAKNDRIENRNTGARMGVLTSYRALSTTNGAGGEFVPPMFLTKDWIAYARAGRVVADACHKEPLPDGTMSISIPKVTGGTSVATQGSQNTNVSDTDLQTAFVVLPVYTKAGMQIVSLQLLERSPIAFDEAVFMDLGLAHAQNVDIAVINGSGSNDVTGILNTVGINTVTWTQGSPTVKGLYGQMTQAKVDINNARFMPATHIFQTPTRWGWIEQTFDSNNRPLVVPDQNGAWNVLQVAPDEAVAQGPTGYRMLSCDLYQDANLPSNLGGGLNQDLVIVSRMDDNWLLESPIVTRALPQTYGQQLSVLLQLYSYIAFSAARYPVSNSIVTGTGLTPPSYNS